MTKVERDDAPLVRAVAERERRARGGRARSRGGSRRACPRARGRRRRRPGRATAGRSTCGPRRGRSGARCGAGRGRRPRGRPSASATCRRRRSTGRRRRGGRCRPGRRAGSGRGSSRGCARGHVRRWLPTSLGRLRDARAREVVGVGLKSDTGLASGVRGAHRTIFACASERLSGPWARVGRDPRPMASCRPADDASSVTVVSDSSVVRAGAAPLAPDVPGTGRSRSLVVAAAVGIPISIVFLVLAIRGTDLGAVWGTLRGVRPLPLLGAVACMGVVYWLQAARWRRIADTAARAAPLLRDGRRRRRGEQRAPGARRGSSPRALGVARRVLVRSRASRPSCSTAASTSWRSSPSCSSACRFVTDEGWVDRIVVGSVLVLAVLGAAPRGRALVHAQAAAFAADAPRAPAPVSARHARGPVRPALGRARASSGSG